MSAEYFFMLAALFFAHDIGRTGRSILALACVATMIWKGSAA